MRFVYVMDPMCSWCYAFQPELDAFLETRANAEVEWIMGGLAPDNQQAMDESLRQGISSYWHQIEKQTQVRFNHDFWKLNTPYRSTYPACRAVIASEALQTASTSRMVRAIQAAYYQEAKNPSLEETLIACACSIGLHESQFTELLKSAETEEKLQQDLRITRQLQVSGFPALFYVNEKNEAYPLALGFSEAAGIEQRFQQIVRHNEA